MKSLSQLTDHVLIHAFEALVAKDRGTTAELIAHIAEIDLRKLYLPAGCPSMFNYCVRVWHMSEDMAYKRIRAARAARRFPQLLGALSDGRLHLAGLVLLVPRLTAKNVDELVTAATHKRRSEIELLLAERFPQSDVRERLKPLQTPSTSTASTTIAAADQAPSAASAVSPGHELAPHAPPMDAGSSNVTASAQCMTQLAPGPVVPSQCPESAQSVGPLSERMPAAAPLPSRTKPLSPGRYALQVTLDQETYELLQQAKALLGHVVASADTAEVLKRALKELVSKLHRAKFAETSKPRPRKSHANGRYIPAEIRREVHKRDGGRCGFVSEDGRRCEETSRLEFDHIHPAARGGPTTAANLRLRCRAHNQFEAERMFGAGFMHQKRERERGSSARVPGREPSRRASPPANAAG